MKARKEELVRQFDRNTRAIDALDSEKGEVDDLYRQQQNELLTERRKILEELDLLVGFSDDRELDT